MHGLDSSIPFFHTRIQGTRIVVTPELVFDVLRVPRVEHLDYPGYERLRTVSKDKMISAFCERPANWSDRQFTPCKTFAKGPRFMNMVMTFVLHPLSLLFALVCFYGPQTQIYSVLEPSVLGHPLILILHLFLSDSVIRRPNQTSLRTSLDEEFIRNAKSFC